MWSLQSGRDSLILTEKDLVQETTKSSQENHSPAWKLLLLQGKIFLITVWVVFNNFQSTRNTWHDEWGIFKCRRTRHGRKKVSGVRCGRQWVSVGWYWLEHGCNLPTKIRHSLSALHIFNNLRMRSMTTGATLIDGEQNKENSHPLSKTPVTESLNSPQCWEKTTFLKHELLKLSVALTENCLSKYYFACLSKRTIFIVFHFIIWYSKSSEKCVRQKQLELRYQPSY